MYVATVQDFVSHYYDYLSVNMDAEVITQLMETQQLLSEDTVMAASSNYQKNCLILEQIIMMNVQSSVSFAKTLLISDSQNHIGKMLTDEMIAMNLIVISYRQILISVQLYSHFF